MISSANPVFSGRLVDLLQHMRWQFDQSPDVTMSVADAERLWPVGFSRMSVLLETFVEVGFLERIADGLYRRRVDTSLN